MAKLLENSETQANPNNATRILKNATIPVPLKYLVISGDHRKCHSLIAKQN